MIRYETKFVPALDAGLVGPDSKAQVLHRWVCTCGRRGVWLEKLTNVEANAAFHAAWHGNHPAAPVSTTTKEA